MSTVVIVQGTFDVDPQEREEFLARRFQLQLVSRSEEGCEEYTFAADPTNPGRVVLTERWASQAHLDAHLAALREGRTPSPADGPQPKSSAVTIFTVAGSQAL